MNLGWKLYVVYLYYWDSFYLTKWVQTEQWFIEGV